MNKLWPYSEAEDIINYYGDDLPSPITLETGFGPSGPPHMGTFGEIARTMFVQYALEDLGYRTEIISFSDDMDGLRKVPSGFPASLQKFLGQPISRVPDPFGCHESYSAHMNAQLADMVNMAGATVHFKYSSEEYQKGTFNEEIKIILNHFDDLRKIVAADYAIEKQRTWFPFFVICEKCGNIYTPRIIDVDADKAEIKYSCDQKFDTVQGCGHIGVISALNGHGKLPWKIDWAARWHALNINYEIYGKDLIPSANISDRICTDIFKWKPPKHMFYELFLDEEGLKISKSKGEAINPKEWLKYGNIESLYYLFFNKPQSAKRISIKRLPKYLQELQRIEQDYYARKEKGELSNEKTIYHFLTNFSPPEHMPERIDFSFLVDLVSALGIREIPIIRQYVLKNNNSDPDMDLIDAEIEKALNFYHDHLKGDEKEITPDDIEFGFNVLDDFARFLMISEWSGEDIHKKIYEIANSYAVEVRHLFRTLYLILLKQERGPRLGNFVKVLGQTYVANEITKKIMKLEMQTEIAALRKEVENNYQMMMAKLEQISTGESIKPDAARESATDSDEENRIRTFHESRSVPSKKLFLTDPYLSQFDAVVTMVDGVKVSLDRTCFFSASGRQVGDTGEIASVKVIDTQYGERDIVHLLEKEPDFKVGDTITASIDWQRRYAIMKLHFASHVMEHFLFETLGPLTRDRAFVNEKYARMTYEYDNKLPPEKLTEVETKTNTFISRNLEIRQKKHGKYSEYTYLMCGEITDPCSGIHPKNTQEIGNIKLKRKSGGRGKEMVMVYLS